MRRGATTGKMSRRQLPNLTRRRQVAVINESQFATPGVRFKPG